MIKQKVTCLVEALLISMGKYFGEIFCCSISNLGGWCSLEVFPCFSSTMLFFSGPELLCSRLTEFQPLGLGEYAYPDKMRDVFLIHMRSGHQTTRGRVALGGLPLDSHGKNSKLWTPCYSFHVQEHSATPSSAWQETRLLGCYWKHLRLSSLIDKLRKLSEKFLSHCMDWSCCFNSSANS